MRVTRRGLITGLVSLVAAPAIVRAGNLMPIKVWVDTKTIWVGPLSDWKLAPMLVGDSLVPTIDAALKAANVNDTIRLIGTLDDTGWIYMGSREGVHKVQIGQHRDIVRLWPSETGCLIKRDNELGPARV